MSPIFCYCVGCLSTLIFMLLGYGLARMQERDVAGEPVHSVFPPFKKTVTHRKKPKSVSELDQWKKEQNSAPLDPGLG